MAKLPSGVPIKIEATQPRNLLHHRKFWALCQAVARASGNPRYNAERVKDDLCITTGHYDILVSPMTGEAKPIPKSISFANMDQTEFDLFFERCVQAIYEHWGHKKKDVIEAVNQILIPTEKRK